MTPITASIVGATGYTGGELIRLLLDHPHITLGQLTSRRLAGDPCARTHPHLRGTDLRFSSPDDLEPCDALFLCLPHGESAAQLDRYETLAPTIVDLSADFRLRSLERYEAWYGTEHPRPDRLESAVYGLPETQRDRLASASLISGVGCNATAMNLALLPLARAGVIDRVICDLKVGSSESGASAYAGSHHPERSRALRTYAPAGHRHAAEVMQECGPFSLDVTVTAVETVRGVLCTAHVLPSRELAPRDLWGLYREAYDHEPFVRIVSERRGMHRLPDPRPLGGTNFADVGFDVDPRSGRIVVLSAIDNLVKGAAGSAIQALNIARGFDETAGLTFRGLHPI